MVIRFHGSSIAIPSYKVRVVMEVKSGARENIRSGSKDKPAILEKEAVINFYTE